jgi:hypothetical protein
VRLPRSAGAGLVLLFLAAHLALLPRTLEDLDSINFALGVRHFDVSRHQPHPPGYPVYIAASKLSTGVIRAIGVGAASSRGLAVWSALGGAAAIPGLLLFFRRLERRDRLAWWAALAVAASPLFWFTALRPLSDMLGFSAAIWALALMANRSGSRELVGGALLAGLAMGIRSQTAVLTLPFLALSLFERRDLRVAVSALGAASIGVLIWGVPLVAASGGLSSYLQALGTQAGEDFSGVVMLWTNRRASVAAAALVNTFIWPWDWWLGIAVCALAAVGGLRILWRAPRVAFILLVAFGPYAAFHLLFQETVTTRYALPLLPVVVYAALAAVEGLPAGAMPAAAMGVAAISLVQAIPASALYASEGAPVFRAFDDLAATAHSGDRVDAIAMHAVARRAAEWAAPILPVRVAKAPHGREWLAMVELWRAEPSARVWFVADPSRTDLALFDGRARELTRPYRWGFVEPPYVGGARPSGVDWYHMQPPNWMLDRGWSVTAEVAGVTARDRLGPQVSPVLAWLKRSAAESLVVLGGRNIGGGAPRPVTLRVALNGSRVADFQVAPGFFVQRIQLPAGALNAPAAYVPLEISSDQGGPVVSLEQFDAQPPGVPMFAFEAGWQEPEYNSTLGRSWRWMSERADLWVRPVGRAVTLRLVGESPLRYFDAAPHVRVLAGDREIAAFDPAADFDRNITVPADLLDRSGGRVSLESSRFFVPGGARGGGDQRHLALRVYSVRVD